MTATRSLPPHAPPPAARPRPCSTRAFAAHREEPRQLRGKPSLPPSGLRAPCVQTSCSIAEGQSDYQQQADARSPLQYFNRRFDTPSSRIAWPLRLHGYSMHQERIPAGRSHRSSIHPPSLPESRYHKAAPRLTPCRCLGGLPCLAAQCISAVRALRASAPVAATNVFPLQFCSRRYLGAASTPVRSRSRSAPRGRTLHKDGPQVVDQVQAGLLHPTWWWHLRDARNPRAETS